MLNKVLKLYKQYLREDIGVIVFLTFVCLGIYLGGYGFTFFNVKYSIKQNLNLDFLDNQLKFIFYLNITVILLVSTVFYIVSISRRFSKQSGMIYNYIQLPIKRMFLGLYGYIEVVVFFVFQMILYAVFLFLANKFLYDTFYMSSSVNGLVGTSVGMTASEVVDFLLSMNTKKYIYNVVVTLLVSISTISTIGILISKFRLNASIIIVGILTIIFGIFLSLVFGVGVGYNIFGNIIDIVYVSIYLIIINIINYLIYQYRLDF